MEGWISLHRQIMENELYFAERFTKMQAWIDLLLLANHKPKTIFIRGIEVKLSTGDMCYSQLSLAKRWKWNFKTVKKFLNLLVYRDMITYSGCKLTTIISIINYSKYQKNGEQILAKSGEQNKLNNKGQSEDLQTSEGEQNLEKMQNRTENRTETDNNVNNDNKKHGLFSKNVKAGNRNWRHRKRNNNEPVLIDGNFIQSYFRRKINQNDIDEINNLAQKYGSDTIKKYFSSFTEKIHSTKIFTDDKLKALQMETIYKKKIEADKKNKITKEDLKKPTFLNLCRDVYGEDLDVNEAGSKYAIA